MKLILMTTPFFFIEEHQILTALFDEGLEALHLRKPGTEPILSERLLSLIPDTYRRRIVVHDHFYLKEEYGLRGIHLNQRNPELPVNYKGHISCTCYSFDEVAQRKRMMDYVLLSRVLPEAGDAPRFTPDALRKQVELGLIDRKVYAQGNIGLDNVAEIKACGFAGAVLFGDIWSRFNIYSNQDYKEILARFRKLRKVAD